MGQTLTFYPRKQHMLNAVPGRPAQPGLPIQRAGFTWDSKRKGYIANKEPFSCDEKSALGKLCLKMMGRRDGAKDPPLYCADEATAIRCGPAHRAVKPEWQNGVWADPDEKPLECKLRAAAGGRNAKPAAARPKLAKAGGTE